jgi:hypothetical protein
MPRLSAFCGVSVSLGKPASETHVSPVLISVTEIEVYLVVVEWLVLLFFGEDLGVEKGVASNIPWGFSLDIGNGGKSESNLCQMKI